MASLSVAALHAGVSSVDARPSGTQHVPRDLIYQNSSAYDNGAYGQGPNQTFHSAPSLSAPAFNILTSPSSSDQLQDGYIFLGINSDFDAPLSGVAIYENDGTLVYYGQQFGRTMHFRPQILNGEAVLTFFDGDFFSSGYGELVRSGN